MKNFKVLIIVLTLFFLGSCALSESNYLESFSLKETKMSGYLNQNDESLPITVLWLPVADGSWGGRFLVLSTFGVPLGDCIYTKDNNICHNAPGADTVVKKVKQAFFAQISQDAEPIMYKSHDTPAWSVSLKNIEY